MVELYIFVLGLLFGSFYNVVGLRLPKGESIVFPGSHCPKCGHKLMWYENIPLISYVFLKGRCKKCKCRISAWYPAIELFTALLFLISYYVFGISEEFFISIVISSLVAIIFVSDVNYMIILDSPLVIGSILICLIRFIYNDFNSVLYSLLNGFIIFGMMYLIMLMLQRHSKKVEKKIVRILEVLIPQILEHKRTQVKAQETQKELLNRKRKTMQLNGIYTVILRRAVSQVLKMKSIYPTQRNGQIIVMQIVQ